MDNKDMGLEVEAKIKLDSHDGVRARLGEAGAKRLGAALETNAIFDDANRSLYKRDCGLRVRSTRREDGSESATLTYKGPQQAGPLKRRQEIELTIGDAAAAGDLFKGLGYVEVLSFQKRRESWELGDCQVELDELPHLGRFVEIEGPSEEAIEMVRASLKLSDHPLIRTTYIALLMEHCRTLGLPTTNVDFPS